VDNPGESSYKGSSMVKWNRQVQTKLTRSIF
jgi:hypothetical protein